PDGDAHARRLPGDPGFLCNRSRRSDDAARDETWPAFILAREDEDRSSFGDVLATIHRLLSIERERLRTRIANLSFDRKHHTSLAGRSLAAKAAHLAPLFHDRASSTPNENRAEPPSTLKIGVPLSKAYNKVPRWSQCLVRLLLVTI